MHCYYDGSLNICSNRCISGRHGSSYLSRNSRNRHLGSHDLTTAYATDPNGFFIGELNSEVISHINAIKYPAHSTFISAFIVSKEHRGKGYGRQTWDVAWKSVDKRYTVGLVAVAHRIPKYEALGFCTVWDTFVAKLDIQIVTKSLLILNRWMESPLIQLLLLTLKRCVATMLQCMALQGAHSLKNGSPCQGCFAGQLLMRKGI